MIKTYTAKVDVTMSGWLDIEAESEQEAREIVKTQQIYPSDLRNFYHLKTDILEIEEEKEA